MLIAVIVLYALAALLPIFAVVRLMWARRKNAPHIDREPSDDFELDLRLIVEDIVNEERRNLRFELGLVGGGLIIGVIASILSLSL
jgi:hypothetical protein